MSDNNSLNEEIMVAHQKHYEVLSRIMPNGLPFGYIIYRLYSNGSIMYDKGYCVEYEDETGYCVEYEEPLQNYEILNLEFPNKARNGPTTYVILPEEDCIYFRNKMIDIITGEYCDVCGRKCDGVHNNIHNIKEKGIQNIVNMLESYGEKMVDDIIKRIYENRRLKDEKV